MVDEAAQGLEAAHALGVVHRDVTPRNILLLADKKGARWVVGDWGMVRRPRGLTSTMRTRPGDPFGTEGFVAPEVMINAHGATERADVYSLGRVFGFALTGEIPVPNIPQEVPEKWRLLVRMLTEQNPDRRVQTMADARQQLRRLLSGPVRSPAATLATLEERIDAGDALAADQLLDLALAAPDDDEIWLDHVVKLPKGLTEHLVVSRPRDLVRGFDSVYRHVRRNWRDRSFNLLNVPLRWLFDAAQAAQANADFSTLEEACRTLFELEVHCARYEQRHRTRAWLEALAGEAAETVARVVQAIPAAAKWYLDEGWSPANCDNGVREALLGGAAE
jgi:serine/threonine protein kinase